MTEIDAAEEVAEKSIYSQIFKRISIEDKNDSAFGKSPFILPSDADYQERVYYRLLSAQKEINDLIDSGESLQSLEEKKRKPIWDPDGQFVLSPMISPISGLLLKRKNCLKNDLLEFDDDFSLDTDVTKNNDFQTVLNLFKNPISDSQFCTSDELGLVVSVIDDIHKNKCVLRQALSNIKFFSTFPQFKQQQSIVWLLLYELHRNRFCEAAILVQECNQEQTDKNAEVKEIVNCLRAHRIDFVESLENLKARRRRCRKYWPISGWINPSKLISKCEANEELSNLDLSELEDCDEGEVPLKENQFKWDKICPLFLSSEGTSNMAKMIEEDRFVLTNRAFAIGPAIFSRLMEFFEIEGDVLQTHFTSLCSIAYLAALAHNNNRVRDFIVYGAGTKARECKDFIKKLGFENTKIYSENFTQVPIQPFILEKVVAIFATPPNSYSAVCDPRQLASTRDGDSSLLEIQIESADAEENAEMIEKKLNEQRESLRLSMSRPQIQFVLYETHSSLHAENEQMVASMIKQTNRLTASLHVKAFKEKKRLEAIAEQEGMNADQLDKLQGISSNKKNQRQEKAKAKKPESESSDDEDSDVSSKDVSLAEVASNELDDEELNHLKIPKTDVFEVGNIPDFCPYRNKCRINKSAECHLTLIRRKKITRLDEKQLILMAEQRGLFGEIDLRKERKPNHSKTTKIDEKTKEKTRIRTDEDIMEIVERVSQPTLSSIARSSIPFKSSYQDTAIQFEAPKCKYAAMRTTSERWHELLQFSGESTTQARAWWIETLEYLKRHRGNKKSKAFASKLIADIRRNRKTPLRLTRHENRKIRNRIKYTLPISDIEFESKTQL